MFTVHYRGFPVECDSALEVVALVTAIETPIKEAKTTPRTAKATTTTTRKTRKPKRTTPDRAEKDKRNAKARAAYRDKHPEKTTTTTSRLQALPSKPTSIGRGFGTDGPGEIRLALQRPGPQGRDPGNTGPTEIQWNGQHLPAWYRPGGHEDVSVGTDQRRSDHASRASPDTGQGRTRRG